MKKNYRANYSRWYGIWGIEFIWHGECQDPEIRFGNHVMNASHVENLLLEDYYEELSDSNKEYGDEGFASYVKDHSKEAKQYCQNCIDNGMAKKIDASSIYRMDGIGISYDTFYSN